ncbi:unnamed protein product, partial [Laminaria digitata]
MAVRILLATTLACVPAAEAFHGAPSAAATGPPAQRLLAGRNPMTQSTAAASFRQQQQQQQQGQRRRSPTPQRACWGNDASVFSQRATASTRTTTAAAAATTTTPTTPRATTTTTTALSLCSDPSLSFGADGDADGSAATKSSSDSSSSSSSSSTLGIAHSVLERTMVPALSGAVLKQSPSDFVVVELPLYAGTNFTPSDVNAPIPEPVRKPVTRKVPPKATVTAATEDWRERWPTASEDEPEPEEDDGEEEEGQRKAFWNLSKGFDAVANWLGASATGDLQDWLMQIATRVSFDAEVEEGGAADVFLPPAEPSRKIRLPCPPGLDKAGRTELHGVFRTHMPYFSTRAIMP